MNRLKSLKSIVLQIGLMLMLLPISSCDKNDNGKSQLAELASNYEKWQNVSLSSYQFVQAITCYCSVTGPHQVIVIDDEIRSVISPVGESIDNEQGGFKTIEELFQYVKTSLEQNPHVATINYNAQYGYPELIYFDFKEYIADDEIGYTISEFTE